MHIYFYIPSYMENGLRPADISERTPLILFISYLFYRNYTKLSIPIINIF